MKIKIGSSSELYMNLTKELVALTRTSKYKS